MTAKGERFESRLTRLLCASLTAGAIGASVVGPAAADALSLDCDNGRSWAERSVCQYDDLRRLDRSLAARYRKVMDRSMGAESEAFRVQYRGWLERRDDCRLAPAPKLCLDRLYRDRLQDLDQELAAIAAPPPAGPEAVRVRRAYAQEIDARLAQFRRLIRDRKGDIIQLWSDGKGPVRLTEPVHQVTKASTGSIKYYFRDGRLIYVEDPLSISGFDGDRLSFWLDRGGRPMEAARSEISRRERDLQARAGHLLTLFRRDD
jgi:uncharacterized protein